MDGASDEFFADTALAADEDRGAAWCGSGHVASDLVHDFACADDFTFGTESFAELDVFIANLVEVFSERLLAAEVFECHGDGIGHGEREFEVVWVGAFGRVCGIQMDDTEDFALASDGGADDAGGEDVAFAIAAAELAVVHDVASEHGLAFAHDRGGEELRHAVVAVRGVAP